MYTSPHTKPSPICTIHYMNRFLNPSKLIETKYCNLPATMSFKEFEKKHRLPSKKDIDIKGEVRRMAMKDVSAVFKLHN
jgi:hypothetical protein